MTTLRCQTCPRIYTGAIQPTLENAAEALLARTELPRPAEPAIVEQGARPAGWLIGEGPTIGGQHVRRVHCPGCTGRTGDGPLVEKWDADCQTCGESASDYEDYDDEPFTEKDAKNWNRDHECEPDVRLITPDKAAERQARRRAMLAQIRAHQAAEATVTS